MRARLLLSLLLLSCSGAIESLDDAGNPEPDAGTLEPDAGTPEPDAGTPEPDAGTPEPDAGTPEPDAGFPRVDRTTPQLWKFQFTAQSIDADAGRWTGNEVARLDTRVAPRGLLVIYLHGAGTPTTCGSTAHQEFLAARGFHTIGPCYATDYGVGNCGDDIGGCRLEAFEGLDHSAVIDITPNESLEVRVVRMLSHLAQLNPEGDWGWFLVDGAPRWDRIIISGISHGGSSAGLIAKVRPVARAVMLSGPLDTNQAWLAWPSLTAAARLWGFTHHDDPQHPGHLAAFETMGLPGSPVQVERSAPPYDDSHRLFADLDAGDPHGSTQAGSSSPKWPDGGYRYAPVWEQLYGVLPP